MPTDELQRPGLGDLDAGFGPTGLPDGWRPCRRLVAVTVSLAEFLCAAGGLVQRLGRAGVSTDLLVAVDQARPGRPAAAVLGAALGELDAAGVRGHRLDLPPTFGSEREHDLIAALSELVGFDPDPGLFCLVPAGDGAEYRTVRRAAQRLVEVYRMRLLSYPPAPRSSPAAPTRAVRLRLDEIERARKAAALGETLRPAPGPGGSTGGIEEFAALAGS